MSDLFSQKKELPLSPLQTPLTLCPEKQTAEMFKQIHNFSIASNVRNHILLGSVSLMEDGTGKFGNAFFQYGKHSDIVGILFNPVYLREPYWFGPSTLLSP